LGKYKQKKKNNTFKPMDLTHIQIGGGNEPDPYLPAGRGKLLDYLTWLLKNARELERSPADYLPWRYP
jgi:hypothetical protein